MKNFKNYKASKYSKNKDYALIEKGIYKFNNPPTIVYTLLQRVLRLKGSHGYKYYYNGMLTNEIQPKLFVTSLTFEVEPKLGESDKYNFISQYPFEELLDRYQVHISDFYDELNNNSKDICYQEFASTDIEDIKRLRELIGRRAYGSRGRLVVE